MFHKHVSSFHQGELKREQRWCSGYCIGLRARGPWFDSRARRYTISEIDYLLLPSRDMAEIALFKVT